MRKLSFSLVSIAAVGAFTALACGTTGDDGPIIVASGGAAPGAGGAALPPAGGTGTTDTGGTSNGATTGSGGSGAETGSGGGGATEGSGGSGSVEGVPLSFVDGWLAADANVLGVQGAVFSYADSHTETGDGVNEPMVTTIEGPTACMAGTAFKVDTKCEDLPDFMFTPPATDCYGEYWGAAIGFNLNQPTIPDPENEEEEIGGDPVAFDATGKISAFSFDLTGETIPSSMRFAVDIGPDADGATQFCSPKAVKVLAGTNTISLADLRAECWDPPTEDPPDVSQIVKIAWAVVTNNSSATPFDFCVSNVIAVP